MREVDVEALERPLDPIFRDLACRAEGMLPGFSDAEGRGL